MMRDVIELSRLPSPAPKPQSLAFDGDRLWMGSIDSQRIYAIDPQSWTVTQEWAAPGKPWGIAAVHDELRVLCGETPEDHRIIRRFVPGRGFEPGGFGAPEDTGSQLGFDGRHLTVSQWYKKQLLTLKDDGTVFRTLSSPHGICGQVVVAGAFFLLTTDNEESNDYFINKIDPAKGTTLDVARVPFHGRALAYDGKLFWTNHRENDEIVAFTLAI
ncbi:MAG: hypothetical protein NVS9B12_13070 [Vulcanimicrobiaceae bacterium]